MTPKALRSEDPPRPQQSRRDYANTPPDTPVNMVSMCRRVLNGETCPHGANCHWRHDDTEAEDIRARAARRAGRQRTPQEPPAAASRTVRFACSHPNVVRVNRFAPLDTSLDDMPPLVPQ